ncbi:hypothetical protein FRC03_003679 [Tulasnella sp. 419]|nr:hypothetical protein FRC03_003679 [Tulasnella sp. 419]
MISAVSTLLALTLAVRTADARRCYYDAYGRYRCSALSNAARVGIGIACAVAALILLALLSFARRRRLQRINKGYATAFQQRQANPQTHQPGAQPQYTGFFGQPGSFSPQQTGGNWTGATPQYPPNAYQQDGGAGGFKPPSGPPPNFTGTHQYQPPTAEPPPNYHYVPPAGPPPGHRADQAV